MKKEYSNDEVTVVWQAGLCVHSANCVKGLPEVFNTKKKPWIDVHAAPGADIISQVKRCPSGALSIKGNKPDEPIPRSKDLEVAGTSPFKAKLEQGKPYAWCACGRSKKQPWCDDSHSSTDVVPLVFKAENSDEAYLCMCKHSKNKPWCDGSHHHLQG